MDSKFASTLAPPISSAAPQTLLELDEPSAGQDRDRNCHHNLLRNQNTQTDKEEKGVYI